MPYPETGDVEKIRSTFSIPVFAARVRVEINADEHLKQ